MSETQGRLCRREVSLTGHFSFFSHEEVVFFKRSKNEKPKKASASRFSEKPVASLLLWHLGVKVVQGMPRIIVPCIRVYQ